MDEEQVCVARRRRSRQEVEQLASEYESSGLRRGAFCREHGLSLSTLSRYQRRQKRQAPAVRNALLAVEVRGQAPEPVMTDSLLAVVLRGGRRIEVGRNFDPSALEQLVRVLEGV